jgi:GntR family transcriptional repressor for pyruvate dehydrogenase complex
MVHYPRVERKHLYLEVMNNLEQMIMDESLKIGDKLPSEHVLAQRFGVSRNVLREAIKGLNERGLIDVKPGKGVFVAKPTLKMFIDMFNRLLVLGGISATHLYEIRLPLEVMCAGLAAQRATKVHIERLKELVQQMPKAAENIDDWCDIDIQFHLTISEASANPLIHSILDPLRGLLVKLSAAGYRRKGEVTIGLEAHRKIFRAIESGDKTAAENAMTEHILRSEEVVLSSNNF